MRLHERFLDYVMWDTRASEHTNTVPSTPGQIDFAKHLVEEIKALGVEDCWMDEMGYVYGSLPSNMEKEVPVIGFLSHVDTADNLPGPTKMPRMIENYDGSVITLESGAVIDPAKDPHLAKCVGQDLIVTDGYTLLGSDDKAGIAEIVCALEYFIQHPEVPHGKIVFSFTPDEEIGTSQDNFNVEAFGAEFAYTVDGGDFGICCYENFNACCATITINGVATHPGDAKDKMKNAMLIGMEYDHMLPPWERPEHTYDHEGFYHLEVMNGTCDHCEMIYLIREHDRAIFENRKEIMKKAGEFMNARYGEGTVIVDLKDGYRNMYDMVVPHMHVVDIACEAIREVGGTPDNYPSRGGTDGAELSWKGVPCPNLGTGSFNHHAVTEVASVQQMEACRDMIIKIVEKYAAFEK